VAATPAAKNTPLAGQSTDGSFSATRCYHPAGLGVGAEGKALKDGRRWPQRRSAV